jgi:hypothetical protein
MAPHRKGRHPVEFWRTEASAGAMDIAGRPAAAVQNIGKAGAGAAKRLETGWGRSADRAVPLAQGAYIGVGTQNRRFVAASTAGRWQLGSYQLDLAIMFQANPDIRDPSAAAEHLQAHALTGWQGRFDARFCLQIRGTRSGNLTAS